MQHEFFKPIQGYEGLYEVSSFGRIKSLLRPQRTRYQRKSEKILKPWASTSGYLQVYLCKENKCSPRSVHRLVAQAFIQNLENKKDINHKNGVKTTNLVENLEWATRSENIKHAFNTGLRKDIGENHPMSKLTTEKVFQIRKMYTGGIKKASIARHFGVTFMSITHIIRGRSWSHI